jgi:hypothetical protein
MLSCLSFLLFALCGLSVPCRCVLACKQPCLQATLLDKLAHCTVVLSRLMPASWIASGRAPGLGHFVNLFKKQVGAEAMPSLSAITLCHHSLLSLSAITLCHHSLPSLSAITLCHHSLLTLSAITLCHHSLLSLSAITLCYHSLPSLSAITLCHHSLLSLSAITLCRDS